ncbi:hypothetical protein [Streptomyces brevispora]|uniref:Tat pathway signal sequence domain protein n=1 Tax=Streptomyces brevispora TaxID=887462 RepID=A0A561V604_9ACTN|nr:hypothetical protein [Streptomyces brevispora]TWG07013.1 hypothetical protein FHX80_115514 [Streptomyces brevispora]
MRTITKRSLFATAVAAAALGLTVTSASATAQATFTIVNPNANGSFTASLKSGTTADLLDTVTNQSVTCYSATATGTATNGVHANGTNLVQIATATFGNAVSDPCDGPLGSSFSAVSTSAINLNATSYAGGITSGSLSNVHVTLTGDTLFGVCTAKISGTASNAKYNNATGELSITNGAGLTVSGVSNCASLMNNGDAAKFSAVYKVAKPLTVTSP